MSEPDRVSISSDAACPLLVVGSVAFDDIITPTTEGKRILGGSASYASLAGSYFAPTRLVGVVGNDFDSDFISRLEKRGIDLEGLQVDRSGPTFFWRGRYHEAFSRRDTLEIQLNVFEHFQPHLPEAYRKTPYAMLGNIQPELLIHVLDQLSDEAFTIADTIDLWIETRRDALLELIKRIDCFVINDEEAEMLTGEANIFAAGRKLLSMGPRCAIIKKGAHGAVLFHPDGRFILPAFPVEELADPTGAGDSFAGAFIGYLAAVNDVSLPTLKQAIIYATATASLTVEAFSCDRLEAAGAAEIDSRVATIRELITP
jgi:sugar/nucleoside kinase (ribokinase family)